MYLNIRILLKILGAIMLLLGAAMIPSAVVSYVFAERGTMLAFTLPSLALLLSGALITAKTRLHHITLRFREGYLTVCLCWLFASVLGAVPYMASGVTSSFFDAFFESVSGFTTTGCTVFDVDEIPSSLILWKAVSHFLGGMGILVFAISILPALGVGGQLIYKAEAPGPTLDKVATRMSDSAKILYITYLVFAVAEFILLSVSPMSPFDALIHTLGSVSTSGLSTHSEGIGYYNSLYIELIISTFTLLSSVNFALYAHAIRGKWRDFFSNTELKAFLIMILAFSVFVSVTLFLRGAYSSIFDAFHRGTFEVIAFATTTGHFITDFTDWPTPCKTALFVLMFIGGCAASTCGGIKVVRVLVMAKLIFRGFARRIHPRAVIAVKLGEKVMPAETVANITSFILTYLLIFMVSNVVLALQNLDFITTVSTSATMLANLGCRLGSVGANPLEYGMFSAPLKLYLSFLMIVGRLELFTIIILLSPQFWNPNK